MIDGFGIQHIKTLIYEYSPQSNAVERVSRNVLAAIRSFLDRDHQEWDGICLGVYHAIASVIWKEKKVYERLIESCVASRYVWAPRKVPFELLPKPSSYRSNLSIASPPSTINKDFERLYPES